MATRTEGPQWEPDAEAVEALEREFRRDFGNAGRFLRDQAAWVLRRQHERESGLLKALKRIRTFYSVIGFGHRVAGDALAAHAKLDAPKVPTLLEAAKALKEGRFSDGDGEHCCVDVRALRALKAAVEREEKGA